LAKLKVILITVIFINIIFCSCYNDNKEDIYILFNSGTCDTNNVTYTKNIKHIFDIHCVNCHNGSSLVCNLNNFANSHSYAVIPNTVLYSKVKDGNHNYQVLTDCEKKQLRIWIATGAN
jgi:hypothetical protein